MPQSSPCAQHDQSSPELHASARYVVYVQETVRKHAQCMQNARDRRHGATEKKARQKPELQVNRSLSIQEKHTAGNSWRPQSISVATQPTAQMSRVWFQPLPKRTSGARYCRVPTKAWRYLSFAQNSAVPKSINRTAVFLGTHPRLLHEEKLQLFFKINQFVLFLNFQKTSNAHARLTLFCQVRH